MSYVYICNASALAALRGAQAGRWAQAPARHLVAPRVPNTKETQRIAQMLDVPLPLHVMVDAAGRRRNSASLRCHVWTGDPACACFWEVLPGICASAPGHLLVEVAARADFENVLMLAYELVGGFALDARAEKGLLMRGPLITKPRLLASLEEAGGMAGAERALRAGRYVLEGARSPREAEVAALLTLPRRLGGRGIRRVTLNKRIDLPPAGQVIAGRSYLVSDIFFEGPRLELGYDSNDNHLSRQEHESDERRLNALRSAGVGFIGMTNGQLRDWPTFEAIVADIEAATRTSFRTTSDGIRRSQHELWRRLVLGRRVNGRTIVPDGPSWIEKSAHIA